MKTIFQTRKPRPEVFSGELREHVFVARSKEVMDGGADFVYCGPTASFDNTYPIVGPKILLYEASEQLVGTARARTARSGLIPLSAVAERTA